jgi:hypothetical protein
MGLRVQPAQQFRPCNSEEARIVVTFGTLSGSAFAGIDNLDTSPVPPEINCSKKAGRPPAYDKTIQHVAVGSTLASINTDGDSIRHTAHGSFLPPVVRSALVELEGSACLVGATAWHRYIWLDVPEKKEPNGSNAVSLCARC